MIFHLLGFVAELYLLLLIARALLSWFQASSSPGLAKVNDVLAMLTEPVLKPIRKIIPPVRVGGTYLDLSILVVFFVIQIVVIPILSR
jgi:YggT family protein